MDKFLGMFAAMCVVFSLEALTIDKWNERIPKDGLKWSRTEDGGIRLTLSARGPRKGGDGYLWAEVPLIERGILDFDYRANPPLRNREQSAFITLYGIRTFFHDGCGDWRVIFPEPNANRETGFHDEPVRHHRIAKVKADEWHHCRIKFDAPNDRAEFFMDDMSDPAFIAGSMSVWSEAEFLGGELRIGGMGGSRNCEAEFRNVILSEAEKDGKSPARTETLVFNGMVHEFYGVEDVLKHDNPRVYLLDFTRYCYWSKNCYKYSRLPGMETVSRARRIVLVDAPASFDHVLPDFLLDDFAQAVEDGAELIVLDGPFALDRGEYAGTPIARILPDGALHGTAFPLPVAEPEILERKVGKGQVKVFRGFRLGSEPCDCRRRFLPWAERLFANSSLSTSSLSK